MLYNVILHTFCVTSHLLYLWGGWDQVFISRMHFTSISLPRHVHGEPVWAASMASCLPPVSPLSCHTSSPPALNCSSRPHLRGAVSPSATPANFIFTKRGGKGYFFRFAAVVSWVALFPRRHEILRVACKRKVTHLLSNTPTFSPLWITFLRSKIGV